MLQPELKEDAPSGASESETVAASESPRSGLDREPNPVKRFLKVLGPGVISGAADDDPSAVGTFATTGASLGFATLWVVPVLFPFMASVQFICAKIGMVSGMGLAGVLKRHYSRKLLYPAVFALVTANTIQAGADIGAIAAGLNLLVPVPISAMIVPIALTILAVQVWCSYRLITNVFKWLTLALFAYAGSSVLARPDLGEVLRATFIPTIRFEASFLAPLVAILGSAISPYFFFWRASQEAEEKGLLRRRQVWRSQGAGDSELKYAAWDTNVGMAFAVLAIYFIILATGTTLFQAGKTDIESAADAAEALRPLAGDAAGLLFAVGLIGAGTLAVPILTCSAAYALSEAFGWRYGLNENPGRARQFYGAMIASTLVGMLINFIGINPIRALFWAGVINGVFAPLLLVLVMLIANNQEIMGRRVNNVWTNAVGWAATASTFGAVVALVLTWRSS